MDTKQVGKMQIRPELLKGPLSGLLKDTAKIEAWQLISELIRAIDILLQNDWVAMKNKPVYYNHKVGGVFPDFKSFEIGKCTTYIDFNWQSFKKHFCGLEGRLLSLDEFRTVFLNQFDQLKQNFGWEISGTHFSLTENNTMKSFARDTESFTAFNGPKQVDSYHIPMFPVEKSGHTSLPSDLVLYHWLRNDLEPEGLSPHLEIIFKKIKTMCGGDMHVVIENNKGWADFPVEKVAQSILSREIALADGSLFDENKALEHFPFKIGSEQQSIIDNYLLHCDKSRCDIDEYDEKIVADPNRGHWELWETADDSPYVTLETSLMARNAAADIRHDGVVGIDFGTKSTVVVYQESNDFTMPMRIGTGNLSKAVENIHYENPTVLEFIDLAQFLTAYTAREGRPDTLWEQVTSSHTAASSLLHGKSEDYYSFLYELKQWAGDRQRKIRLRDKQGKEFILPAFLDIEASGFNPIEIYAYYIGLHINNMRNGIYLDYLLSFPVTYEQAVREKILESFTAGIKKSLPPVLLKNQTVMAKLRVNATSSEPAAYAIIALQEYGFSPEGNEKVFYGVFDFGGGTTDFDFGTWREADPQESKRYDYVLDCFKDGGDRYLGGENLLELLAFEVFKKNQALLREQGVTFVLPPECNRFPGCELLIGETQEAKINMARLMEKVRSFWERTEGWEEQFGEGKIKVNLFDKKGNPQQGFELDFDKEEMNQVLEKRIEKGVINFFESLRLAFAMPLTKDVQKVHIFLAGNSCKSELVQELFQSYIQKTTLEVGPEQDQVLFELYPPLGTSAAQQLQRERGVTDSRAEATSPTCKTGVAFGVIAGRPGGKIKINLHKSSERTEEIRFKYYIGISKKKRFYPVSDRDLPYGEWREFIDASEQDFSIYYSDLPEASAKTLAIQAVNRKNLRIAAPHDKGIVGYRAVNPSAIEYAVAETLEKLQQGDYIEAPVRIDLS